MRCLLLLTDRYVYKFYRTQRSTPVIYLIASIGVMFLYNGLIRFIIGPNDQQFSDGERFIIRARDFKEMTGLDQGLAIKTTQGITVVVTILLVIALFWFLNRTRAGKSMRAYSDNEDLALLSGIDPDRVGGHALRPRQEFQALHVSANPAADLRGGHCRGAGVARGGDCRGVRDRVFGNRRHLRMAAGSGVSGI